MIMCTYVYIYINVYKERFKFKVGTLLVINMTNEVITPINGLINV